MFKNYLKIAIRNLVRHKIYSFINVFGLAVGIAFCILTFLFVRHEWTYDAFHENADSIYRVISFAELDGKAQAFAISPAPMAPALIQESPGVKRAVRFKKMGGVVNYKDKSFNERILLMDPSFFQVFSFPLLKGNPATVLNNKNSIVISAEVARKYFGHEDPLGKSVSVRTDGYYTSRIGFQDFIVRGVVRKAPENSSIQFDFLLPFTNYTECKGYSDDWGRGDTYTYIQLSDNVRVSDLERQIALLSGRHYRDQYGSEGHPKRFLLQPITDIHLKTF
ncbi:MAG TPA: hypothetical protein EYP19_03970 [Desulfobacterales bacterium]|nr:hypothetical protein [Desulfobacterales bacterium]